ncbi:MAG: GAP1-N2 domain-containing protein [Gemmataceae bacterium]
MNPFTIEQAIYGGQAAGGYHFLARSPGFREEWLAEAEGLCTGFGERPAGIACPGCVFARPFGRHHVAVVQVADQGSDDTGRPGALGFHLLILPRLLYRDLGGDPFYIAEQFPPLWQARGALPSLTWTAEAPPRRSVAMLQKTLNVPNSATLLGGAQILLDGGRLVFERSAPDAAILRGLWALLPTRERAERWPASFTFSNVHGFDAVVVPRAADAEYENYITEEKAGDYPEGRYECNLQSAIETGDQQEIDALLNYNRSRMLRLIVVLLLVVVLLSAAMSVLLPGPHSDRPMPDALKSSALPLDLPPENECPTLDVHERSELADRLQILGNQWHMQLPKGNTEDSISAALTALDKQLGTPDPRRDPGPLRSYGPLQRQLRVLLWKHGVAEYSDRRLNAIELLERLRQRVDQERNPRE